MFYAEKYAQYIKEIKYDQISENVRNKIKECIIDSIGCAIGGSFLPAGQILIRTLSEIEKSSDSFIWGNKEKTSVLLASYINSALANAMDFDDTIFVEGPTTGIHPGCTVIHPAFILGSFLGKSGKEILEAILAGYEIQARIAEAVFPSPDRLELVKGQGTFLTFGSLAVGVKLLNLDHQQICHAFGITGANAPIASTKKIWGNQEMGITMVKNNVGMASFNGILSSFLAKYGFTGPWNIFEGETGFWTMTGSDQFFPERLDQKLGKKFKVLDVSLKPYPCCRYLHSSIDAVLDIINLNKIKTEDIDSILIETHPYLVKNYSFKNPKDEIEAAFCLPLAISLELLKLPYGFKEDFEKNIRNEKILSLMQKIVIRKNKQKNRLDNFGKGAYPARAIVSKGHKKYRKLVNYPLGSAQNPMNHEQIRNKFFRLSRKWLDEKKSKDLYDSLNSIEEVSNIKKDIFEKFK